MDVGFNLRKFVINSQEVQTRILNNERLASRGQGSQHARNASSHQVVKPTLENVNAVEEKDMTYSKSILGNAVTEDVGKQRILGTLWDLHIDNLVFDLTHTASLARRVEPTERNVISTASKYYDLLGVISPITVLFKLLFRELCKDKKAWDKQLEGPCKFTWQIPVAQLHDMQPITLPDVITLVYKGKRLRASSTVFVMLLQRLMAQWFICT